jgi:hypothetical protein
MMMMMIIIIIIIGGGVFCLILAIVAMLGIGWWLNYEFQKAVQEHGLEATLLGCSCWRCCGREDTITMLMKTIRPLHVYLVVNKATGMKYVGITRSRGCESRWLPH